LYLNNFVTVYALRQIEGAIKNGHSRETGNTRHESKTNKTQKHYTEN